MLLSAVKSDLSGCATPFEVGRRDLLLVCAFGGKFEVFLSGFVVFLLPAGRPRFLYPLSWAVWLCSDFEVGSKTKDAWLLRLPSAFASRLSAIVLR
jgi:hypothetical protein